MDKTGASNYKGQDVNDIGRFPEFHIKTKCAFSIQCMCDIITLYLTCRKYKSTDSNEAAGKNPCDR